MRPRSTIEHFAPWLGLVAAGLGWGLSHQIGSNAVFDDCRVAGNGFVLIICLAGLIMWVPGGLYHLVAALWFLLRGLGDEESDHAVAR